MHQDPREDETAPRSVPVQTLHGRERALRPAGPFSVQRNAINPQQRMPAPADGYFRRGGGFSPPAAFKAHLVKSVARGRDPGQTDLGWSQGITSVRGGMGEFLLYK